jgi:hypothetical protein
MNVRLYNRSGEIPVTQPETNHIVVDDHGPEGPGAISDVGWNFLECLQICSQTRSLAREKLQAECGYSQSKK